MLLNLKITLKVYYIIRDRSVLFMTSKIVVAEAADILDDYYTLRLSSLSCRIAHLYQLFFAIMALGIKNRY